ncbi:hypothetical protein THIOM_000463 [Candidatus Thiomargarita nelsonii]|uniref:Uncharacterized protein n=1 Tax=Candidatus Thiomargarita nelsonii TaxID=1003181 RepID=A0A176S721_9GAMM|nr:hypothetical protein THIOM_000463 [Candidatus Thiomargarita nelsonii]
MTSSCSIFIISVIDEFDWIFFVAGRGASWQAFPRRAWERVKVAGTHLPFVNPFCCGFHELSE